MLHFPYHSYQPVINWLDEAAIDPFVKSIKISLYRVAADSRIVAALIRAAGFDKQVTAFVELKARFDEESNFRWANELESAGVKVLYSFPGLKVHAKICLIERLEDGRLKTYGFLATGNFNEKTARLYTDLALFTTRPEITDEMQKVFAYLRKETDKAEFGHLLVAPFNLRSGLYRLIDREIEYAKNDQPAEIFLKMNSLQDPKIINRLYKAGQAGVKIRIIVRGICCLIPGVKGMSENIEVISIVDRFLEHSRIFVFHNGGDKKYYVGSADWMKRNLSRRIEVVFPVYDENLQRELDTILDIQWRDNRKARIVDAGQTNGYRESDGEPLQAQTALYAYYRSVSK